jgi:pSer/pThr/pTyr-binding forkhead associated (FHA) protein
MDTSKIRSLSLNSFVHLSFAEDVIAEYEIDAPRLTVGRHPDCDIIVDNAGISGLHAFLIQQQGRFYVKDAMSKNGLMLNGEKRELIELCLNQRVDIGGKYALELVKAPSQTISPVTGNTAKLEATPAETMMVSASMMAKMAQMGQQVRPAYLIMAKTKGGSWILRLDKLVVTVGRAKTCDIRTGGWFAPAQLASIERGVDGFWLTSAGSNRVTVNDNPVQDRLALKEGDRLQLGRETGVFHA